MHFKVKTWWDGCLNLLALRIFDKVWFNFVIFQTTGGAVWWEGCFKSCPSPLWDFWPAHSQQSYLPIFLLALVSIYRYTYFTIYSYLHLHLIYRDYFPISLLSFSIHSLLTLFKLFVCRRVWAHKEPSELQQARALLWRLNTAKCLIGKQIQTSPQAKRHKPSLLFTSLTISTFITR